MENTNHLESKPLPIEQTTAYTYQIGIPNEKPENGNKRHQKSSFFLADFPC